jgi:MFS family permease
MFIALLDIQIVSASLRDIGGGLSAGSDETAWVQTSYLIAEIIVIPLSGWLSPGCSRRVGCSARRRSAFTLASLLVRHRLEHPEHDRLSCTARFSRRLDDSAGVHHGVLCSSPVNNG